MSYLNFIIHLKFHYTDNLILSISKRNNEDIKIAVNQNKYHKITQKITPTTLLKDLSGILQNHSLKNAYFICSCENNHFYCIKICFELSKIKQYPIEDIIKNIEKKIRSIPKKTIEPLYIENMNIKVYLYSDYMENHKIKSFLCLKKEHTYLERSPEPVCYTDQHMFIEANDEEHILSFKNTKATKDTIDKIFQNIILHSESSLTEHERITMLSKLRRETSHYNIINLMKTRYQCHIQLEKECQKILKNI